MYILYSAILCVSQGAEVRKMRSEVAELKKMVITTKSKTESLATQVNTTVMSMLSIVGDREQPCSVRAT